MTDFHGVQSEAGALEAEFYALVAREPSVLQWLLEHRCGGVVYSDLEQPGREWLSPGVALLLGHASKQPFWARVHSDDRAPVDSWQSSGQTTTLEQWVRWVSNTEQELRIRCWCRTLRDARGRATRRLTLCASSELTRQEDLERQLHECLYEMERVASATSHDLQAPLRAVRSFAELLSSRYGAQLDVSARRYLGHIVEGAALGQGLANDLVAFVRAGLGLVPQPLELEDVVRQALAEQAPTLEAMQAVVQVGALPRVMGSETSLRRVFCELLTNSIRFRHPERTLSIQIEAEVLGASATVHVSDNGIGFAEAHAEKIFELFRKLHPAKEYPGRGFGLALVRRVLSLHGGRAWAQPRDEGGARVSLEFPHVADG